MPKQQKLTNIPGILPSDIPINSKRHRPTDKVCPLCRVNPAWEHIPYLKEATWGNYDNPMLACWVCFHSVWAGER